MRKSFFIIGTILFSGLSLFAQTVNPKAVAVNAKKTNTEEISYGIRLVEEYDKIDTSLISEQSLGAIQATMSPDSSITIGENTLFVTESGLCLAKNNRNNKLDTLYLSGPPRGSIQAMMATDSFVCFFADHQRTAVVVYFKFHQGKWRLFDDESLMNSNYLGSAGMKGSTFKVFEQIKMVNMVSFSAISIEKIFVEDGKIGEAGRFNVEYNYYLPQKRFILRKKVKID